MTRAIVLINSDLGTEKEIVNRIKMVPNVKEAHIVYGVYDIVAMVEAETAQLLKGTVQQWIRTIEGIKSTLTMMVVEN
jgi:DNA-binding Lrp family transcriptional regulator